VAAVAMFSQRCPHSMIVSRYWYLVPCLVVSSRARVSAWLKSTHSKHDVRIGKLHIVPKVITCTWTIAMYILFRIRESLSSCN